MRSASRLRPHGKSAAGVLLLLAVLVGPGRAEEVAERVGFQVTVLEASPQAGAIDPEARRFHRLLGKRVRYESLRVLDTHHTELGLGDIGRVELPTGTRFRFRPLDVGGQGVLVAIDMGQTTQGDFRIPKGKPLVLGGQPYQDGQLVVILEAGD